VRTRIIPGSGAPEVDPTGAPEGQNGERRPARANRQPDAATTRPRRTRRAPDPDPDGANVRARDLRSAPDAPLVLGRYRLRRRLGSGGFATVWLAHDERLEREVAVKILPRERVIGGRFEREVAVKILPRERVIGGRFEREARAAARLAHPGIVTLYEAAVDDEGAYLVSELVHGSTLDELLAGGRLSDRDVLWIGIALCDALAHAHAHGVIHRDVKPSNVLVPERRTTPAQHARLTDFGVAHVAGGDTLTRTGDVIGTEAYMAPEQAQGLPAGEAADLFSLALVLYEALSGTNPLRGPLGSARRSAVHLPPLRRQRRDLPRELGRSIDLALRPRPSERGRLGELRAALVASVARVADEPGVVADPWPTRTLARSRTPEGGPPFAVPEGGPPFATPEGGAAFTAPEGGAALTTPEPDEEPFRADEDVSLRDEVDRREKRAGPRHDRRPATLAWPRRALAGLAVALITAWLARHGPASAPLAAALAACIAGLLVVAVPRAGWLTLALAAAVWLIIESRPGEALVILAAAVIPAFAAPRDGPAWPLSAAAPALAPLGLTGAWPALAGLTRRAHRRAALGATGYIWAALAGRHIGAATTLPDAIHQVLGPVARPGTLIAAGIWAAAAVALPFTRSRRWAALEAFRLALWAVALGVATLIAEHAAGAPHTRTIFLGAGVGALVALVTSRFAVGLKRRASGEDQPSLP
jgi:eukaryotic-like serine/threonine-protein kinase